jgi:AcrR family transcriptional regulator
MLRSIHARAALALLVMLLGGCATVRPLSYRDQVAGSWQFVVAGDSRNCGDVVMPAIAAATRAHRASFYWHLGDLRAIYAIDEDYHRLHPSAAMNEYLSGAWDDFIQNQVDAFADTPFYLGIGNHETIAPKTREQFALSFADWLDSPLIKRQRLLDDPHDHTIRPYYHWIQNGVDFIYLDNATPDQFDDMQLAWLKRILLRDTADSAVRAIVVGMHEALPDSIASGHSMSDSPKSTEAGRAAYQMLLEARSARPVYVLMSHSHFVMAGVFDTPYWREHGGVLPGWIVGTAGAVRYPLPPNAAAALYARTKVYGYLEATVSPPGTNPRDPVSFTFHEITEPEVPAEVSQRFGAPFVHQCFAANASF